MTLLDLSGAPVDPARLDTPALDPAVPDSPVDPVTLDDAPHAAALDLVRPARYRSAPAAPRRTLLDVLADTAARHPAAAALDDGDTVLDYRALLAEVHELRARLAEVGVGRGDRVGVRVPSGTRTLYVAVLAVLAAGAAYVPVDADDPDERAELVFTEADVSVVLGADATITVRTPPHGVPGAPTPDDDAWIIFTSGSTGTPKGVAVTHAAAAAFVDAEAALFLPGAPLGPGDRVLAGLSVAFDASCEEMWLAWRHGACLVPAPRALVRTGMDLGPWLVERGITVISTVPTLAALWPSDALDQVRLLIFGGEACPPELGERLAVDGREVWNTYGPTEATVVACAARLTGSGPVRIGLPLAGWDLAVVDAAGELVGTGEIGELVIGGAGLARYLDPAKDAAKFAPLPALGWARAYRSGDLVRADAEGLVFVGRADEQVKLGGRRIELGEVDAALQALPGVAAAAGAVRTTDGGQQVLVGYLVPAGDGLDLAAARDRLRTTLPAALVPLLAEVDTLPTRTSGKVDRAALPWPLPAAESADAAEFTGTAGWLAGHWAAVLGAPPSTVDDDFFACGGGSLSAVRLVSLVRQRFPGFSVSELYQAPTLGELAELLDGAAHHGSGPAGWTRLVRPTPRAAQLVQTLSLLPLFGLVGLRFTVALAALNDVLAWTGVHTWAPTVPWWLVGLGWLLFVSPPGRIAVAAGGARILLRGVEPGSYPRGGRVHVRLWAAERLAVLSGATNLSGTWITYYARALGVRIGDGVDLHALPPVTGMLWLGKGCAVEPEVDLAGHWLDGDTLHLGTVTIGAGARVGARSTLFPDARVGKRAEIAPGSGVHGVVPSGQHWAGVPAKRVGRSTHLRGGPRPVRSRRWTFVYGATSLLFTFLPLLAALPAVLVAGAFVRPATTLSGALVRALLAVPPATVCWLAGYALLVLAGVRAFGIGLRAGNHPVFGRIAWQAWATERLMHGARVTLFPLYASMFTPTWLRLLGMRVGRDVEASTVLALPSMTKVGDGAFLADDTLVAAYELGGGRLRIAEARVGKRAFLGNSGMTAPGRKVPKRGLVAVLSATPERVKKGTSYLGMPPVELPRTVEGAADDRTYAPPRRLKFARAAVELCRILPVMCGGALAVTVLAGFEFLAGHGFWLAALLGGPLLLGAGASACAVALAAKWSLVGRFRAVQHPLWSSFVWRNELADTFGEVLAVPWLVGAVSGSPVLNLWLRGLGARIGRGAWCETYWLPEADLIRIGDGATVNRGCVVQTHLFHDRIMRMDQVTLGAGATMGPHGIVLPGAAIGANTTIGPASLVLRGEHVPPHSRWLGNPIAAWH